MPVHLRHAAFAIASLTAASSTAAAVVVTVETPGRQTTSQAVTGKAVETFDGLSTGHRNSLFTAVGTLSTRDAVQPNSGIFVQGADVYGGAGGGGNYLTTSGSSVLDLDAARTYFGLWASALDGSVNGGNSIAFYKGGQFIDRVSLRDFPLAAAYAGNPNRRYLGGNGGEMYAFFNFAVDGGYDRVILMQNLGGGFEADNLTTGSLATHAVPEPATWALLLLGFGLVGTATRARRRRGVLPSLA